MSVLVGRNVLYTLSEQDAQTINQRRESFTNLLAGYRNAGRADDILVLQRGNEGNRAEAGQVYPAVIVSHFDASVNLQVMLDGHDTFWVKHWTGLTAA